MWDELQKTADRNVFLKIIKWFVHWINLTTFWQATLHPHLSLARNPLPRFPAYLHSAHCPSSVRLWNTVAFLEQSVSHASGALGGRTRVLKLGRVNYQGNEVWDLYSVARGVFSFFGGCSLSRTWAWMWDWGSSGSWERRSEGLVTVPVRTASWSGLVRTARPTATWTKLLMWAARITTLGKRAWEPQLDCCSVTEDSLLDVILRSNALFWTLYIINISNAHIYYN